VTLRENFAFPKQQPVSRQPREYRMTLTRIADHIYRALFGKDKRGLSAEHGAPMDSDPGYSHRHQIRCQSYRTRSGSSL
jgi:hypothetical protein